MNPKYKTILLFNLIWMLMLLNGCGFKDIDKRFFVVSIGIDKAEEEGNYNVSLKFAIPSQELSAGENEFVVVSEEAKTITEAIRKIKTKVDKEVDFSHTKIILYGEELAKEEIKQQLVYWFIRRRDIQNIAWVAIAKPTALDVLNVKPRSERLPSNYLFIFFGQTGTESAYVTVEPLFNFKMKIKERGIDPVLPIVETKKDRLQISTAALLDKKKIITTLTSEETKILNFLIDNVEKMDIKIERDEKYFMLASENGDASYSIKKDENDKLYILYQIKLRGIIEEALFPVFEKDVGHYEKLAEEEVKEHIYKFLVKIQELELDPIGFGQRYRSRSFQNETEWETWQSIYPDIEFKLNVDIKIDGTGTVE